MSSKIKGSVPSGDVTTALVHVSCLSLGFVCEPGGGHAGRQRKPASAMGDRRQGSQKPYRLRKNVVLFDVLTLASDWDRMKEEAEAAFPVLTVAGRAQANAGRSAIRGTTCWVRAFAAGFRSPWR